MEYVEPLIRMHFFGCEPVLTVAEFIQIERDLLARVFADDVTPGDTVLASLLTLNRGRFLDCCQIINIQKKRQALADHLLLVLDDSIRYDGDDIYQAHEARWRVTGVGPYEFTLVDSAKENNEVSDGQ